MGVSIVVQNLTGARRRMANIKIFDEAADAYNLCCFNMPAANFCELLDAGKI
jgi:hypothetical protein